MPDREKAIRGLRGVNIRGTPGMWCDDISFCPDEKCRDESCPRNMKNIRDKSVPHSFFLSRPDDCPRGGDRRVETSIDYVDYTVAVVSTGEPKWHRRLRAWREEYPDLVRIKTEPEGNDGNMVATVPVNWVVLRPPMGLRMTDEQRAARAENLRKRTRGTPTLGIPEDTEGESE